MKRLSFSLGLGLVVIGGLVACGSVEDPSQSTALADRKGHSGSGGASATTGGGAAGDCTYTQGYWKNHPGAWPVTTLVIGGVSYDEPELLTLFGTPPKGDVSLILGHQLIAALLNVAGGAVAPPDVQAALASADAWMASHKDADGRLPYGVSTDDGATALASTLDSFNSGLIGPGHCGDTTSASSSAAVTSSSSAAVTSSSSGGEVTTSASSSSSAAATSSSSGGGSTCQDNHPVCGPGLPACPAGWSCIEPCCSPNIF